MKATNHTLSKRLWALLLALSLLLALAACGAQSGDAPSDTDEQGASSGDTEDAGDAAEDAQPEDPEQSDAAGGQTDTTYSLIQNVYNWGSSYSAIILPVSGGADAADPSVYTVSVQRFDTAGELLDEGERTVTGAYLSDAAGAESADGGYVTLTMEVAANLSAGSPYYTDPNTFLGALKSWADCQYTVTNSATGETWNELDTVYHPDEEGFQTDVFSDGDISIPYAFYAPAEDGESHPLIVWLHGQGSGGTDIGFVTGGMLVTNWITEESQEIFGGAHVLLPQAETQWLDDGSGSGYSADGSSIFTAPLMALIEDYLDSHPDADPNRIYLAGCSNGGFMAVNMALNYPGYFAAIVPVCEAYTDEWISDEQIEALASTPTWFVHCSNDPVVDVTTTSVPTYERLLAAGAENLHYSTYETITDPDSGFEYNGHFAWVYALANLCSTDYDGSPVMVDGQEVSLFEWMAAQSK